MKKERKEEEKEQLKEERRKRGIIVFLTLGASNINKRCPSVKNAYLLLDKNVILICSVLLCPSAMASFKIR